jgi:hypothetical protein
MDVAFVRRRVPLTFTPLRGLEHPPHLRLPATATRRVVYGTTPYNSIRPADDRMMVNAHVRGVTAYGAPVWHLRRSGDGGGMFDPYAESCNAVRATSTPVED